MDQTIVVSASPHLRSASSTRRIMIDVLIALCPAAAAAAVLFGLRAPAMCAVCITASVLSEYVCRRVMKRDNTVGDCSAAVTGLLLALNLPVSLPMWMAVIGCVFAIVVVKQCFGGIGQNFMNPALAGRIFLTISFPSQMSTWTEPRYGGAADAVTTATPLESLGAGFQAGTGLDGQNLPSILQMFLGQRAGSLGEVCIAALLLGFVYLLVRRVISPVIPLTYVGTVFVLMLIAGQGDFRFALYQILGGGLVLGAVYMATDYTTSPITARGKDIYAAGCGILTVVIRLFASLPEGVSFSIILMNIFVVYIERFTTPKPFGAKREKHGGKGEAA
ncbi:MAG: RnfABCDGE type electron transport complex subunit D [Clostridiales bacterium]|nr:RnfABCDGE type electron transport complex subunit D [Clostridiales bacterium]